GSSFITEVGMKQESAGVGATFSSYGNNKAIGLTVASGTQYMIGVDGSSQDPNGGMGGINLNVSLVPTPPNDNWSEAQLLTFNTNTLQGTVPDGTVTYTQYSLAVPSYNIGATIESGESQIGSYTAYGTPGRSIWFTFTAPASGYYSICTTNSLFHTQVGIKPTSAGEGAGWSSYPISGTGYIAATYLTSGTPYMVCVDGTTLDQGYGLVNLEISSIASPGNDAFVNAAPIPFTTNYMPYALPNGIVTNVNYTARLTGQNYSAT